MSLSGNMASHSIPQMTGGNGSLQHLAVNVHHESETRNAEAKAALFKKKAEAEAAERKLTRFAVQLAVLQLIATGLGAMGFIWATVVILGGFVSVLQTIDFWFVTIILLIEGARLISRTRELEWQHRSTSTKPDSEKKESAEEKNNEEKSTNTSLRLLLSNVGRLFQFRDLSQLFYCLQLLSALACITLSAVRLLDLNHVRDRTDQNNPIMGAALHIFYGLALVEGFICLLEILYWEGAMSWYKLLDKVNDEIYLGDSGPDSFRRFLNDVYSECVNKSISDALKMDLVSFASKLVVSDSADKQLIGVQILHKFSCEFADETVLDNIGTSMTIIERLLEILRWEDSEEANMKEKAEADMRVKAAEIVSILAEKRSRYSSRIIGIPGVMDSISSLLYTQPGSNSAPDELDEKKILHKDQYHGHEFALNKFGLTILHGLVAHGKGNCEKIIHTRGLLSKIIECTNMEDLLHEKSNVEEDRILVVKHSLEVLKLLAGTSSTVAGNNLRLDFANKEVLKLLAGTSSIVAGNNLRLDIAKAGTSTTVPGNKLRLDIADNVFTVTTNISTVAGTNLRRDIANNVFTLTNIREILQFGEKYPKLQLLGIEILINLAFDNEATEIIGRTGGIIKELFRIFFQRSPDDSARVAAGEAIAMLALDCEENCTRILKQDDEILTKLVRALETPEIRISSAKILRYLCKFAHEDCKKKLQEECKFAAARTMLKGIMSEECELKDMKPEESKLQEMMLGLATQVFKLMTPEEASKAFNQVGIDKAKLPKKLLQILNFYRSPPIKFPRMRRFAIKLAILLIDKDIVDVQNFPVIEMAEEIKKLSHTTSEIESFNVFAGRFGLSRNGATAIHTLVEKALKLLNGKSNNSSEDLNPLNFSVCPLHDQCTSNYHLTTIT